MGKTVLIHCNYLGCVCTRSRGLAGAEVPTSKRRGPVASTQPGNRILEMGKWGDRGDNLFQSFVEVERRI